MMIKWKYGLAALLSLGIVACQSARIQSEADSEAGPVPVIDPLYPVGLYAHRVKLEIADGDRKKTQEFTAMTRLRGHRFAVLLSGPFGVGLASFEDDLGKNQHQMKIASNRLERYQVQLEQFFVLLENLVLYPRRESSQGAFQVLARNSEKQPTQMSFQSESGGGQIILGQYLGNGPAAWPQQWKIQSPRLQGEATVKRSED